LRNCAAITGDHIAFIRRAPGPATSYLRFMPGWAGSFILECAMNRDIRARLSGIIVPVIAVAMLATVAKELPGGLRVDPAPACAGRAGADAARSVRGACPVAAAAAPRVHVVHAARRKRTCVPDRPRWAELVKK